MRTLPLLALIAGCAPLPPMDEQAMSDQTPMANVDDPIVVGEGTCDAAPVQRFVGRTATAELGAEMLRLATATVLRWAPPDSALTMDYREDRLTVAYDRDLTITRIGCG